MTYLFLWILSIPALYVIYYSDIVNKNVIIFHNVTCEEAGELDLVGFVLGNKNSSTFENVKVTNKNKKGFSLAQDNRKPAFLLAVSGPFGLAKYLVWNLCALLKIIMRTGQLGNPFYVFPLHNPWKDNK